MLSLWTLSKLSRLPADLRRKITFYAPLTDSLDFKGNDPVSFTRAGASTATRRDGLAHAIAANVPRFEYDGEQPLGLLISSGETLQFSAQNNLHDASSLIWFEEALPKSTPTDPNPIDNTGTWTGNLDVHVKHILKASAVLAISEIQQIQSVIEDIVQEIPPPPPPPSENVGTFMLETPTHQGGGVYLLSQDPNLDSLLIIAHGGLTLARVASAPEELEYTVGGTGNRTITPGLAPNPVGDIEAQYVIAGS